MTKLNDSTAPQDDNEVGGEDWDKAFDEFYEKELEDDNSDDTDSGDDSSDSGDDTAADEDSNSSDDKSTDDDSSDDKRQEDVDEKNNSDKKDVVENNDDKKDEPDQRSLVKDAVKEVFTEQQTADAELRETFNEALAVIRPNGVEDPRVDSDGDRITSPADVEKLYNPATGELYTPSEAKAWYDKATAQYEQNVQVAQREAVHVAQTAQKMNQGREAVMRAYGDFINENPEIAKKVLTSYLATMKYGGEGDNQYILDAPVDILEFYNDHMYPYVELAERKKEAQEREEAEKKAKEDAIKKGKAQRDESRDFTTNVSEDATKTGDEMDWDDAFKSYYGSK